MEKQLQQSVLVKIRINAIQLAQICQVVMCYSFLFLLFLSIPNNSFAGMVNSREMVVHLMHDWQDAGNDLTFQTEYGNLFYRDDSQGTTGHVITGATKWKDDCGRVVKALFRCTTGVAVKIYVDSVEQNRIIGIEDFQGRLWTLEAMP